MRTLEEHLALIEERIAQWIDTLPEQGLYEPMAYLLRMPAKRVRPVSLLLACELFGGRAEEAMDEALGIELFHNFTLMHDDIMDAAPRRRGQATVHTKWNVNTAILSGDALMVMAQRLLGSDPTIADLFSRYALEVCEGQKLDMDFEARQDVALSEYTTMIRKKTAVLLSCALQVGAMRAGAPALERERLGRVGEHIGLAFQLKDDLLDAFGDPDKVGKQLGGDLLSGKKTWLLIRGLELSSERGDDRLGKELAKEPAQRDVTVMIEVLASIGARDAVLAEIERMGSVALEELNAISVPEERKAPLFELANMLMARVR